jgi:hypothetical protein
MDAPTPDVREVAARAHWAASNGRLLRADEELPPGRNLHRIHADAILAAVTPVIRQQVAEEIAQRIDELDDRGYAMYGSAFDECAAIARSRAEIGDRT